MANYSIVLVSMLSIVALAVAQDPQQPQVVREKNNNDGSGNYLFT